MSYKKKLRAAERAERRSELLNKIEKFKGYTTSKAGDDFDKPRSPADQEIWHKISEMEIEISQLDDLDYADMELGKKILLWIQFVLQNVAYDASSLADTVINQLQNLFENLGKILVEEDKGIIAKLKHDFATIRSKRLPLYERTINSRMNECQNLLECLCELPYFWRRIAKSDFLPSFPSIAIEKVFALIPYSKKDMKTKLPIRVMENIFEFVDLYFGNPNTLDQIMGYYAGTRGIVFDEERIEEAKKVMTAAFGCLFGLHITPKILIPNTLPNILGTANLKDFASSLSAEELANNFENNLKNWKNRFEKGVKNYDEVDKRVHAEYSGIDKKENIFSRIFSGVPDFFIHDYYAEARKELENEYKKDAKYYSKNDKRFKDAEYILANRKLREKFLGEEYDDNIELGVANKNKELLEKLKSKNVEK